MTAGSCQRRGRSGSARPLRGCKSKVFARNAAQAKFSSTFSKRWQDSKGRRPLAAGRSQRNALYFRRIWGFGGLYKRKAPKAPLFYAYLGGKRPPRWGGGPAGARGGPSFVFPGGRRWAGNGKVSFVWHFPASRRVGSPWRRGSPSWGFPASCRRGCRVPPRQAGYFLARARK